MKKSLITTVFLLMASPSWGAVWMIGDDDGYGIGIPDNADHTFGSPIHDGRTPDEVAATNGAQYTDTYSTTQGSYSPADQIGDVATFSFTGLGNGWTEGSMWFDMADFQAGTFGSTEVRYNGILQNWAFNDGYPSTVVRFFDLAQNVLDSINLLGTLDITIDRNGSGDFYGFDYVMLSDRKGNSTNVPAPGSLLLLGAGMIALFAHRRRKVLA